MGPIATHTERQYEFQHPSSLFVFFRISPIFSFLLFSFSNIKKNSLCDLSMESSPSFFFFFCSTRINYKKRIFFLMNANKLTFSDNRKKTTFGNAIKQGLVKIKGPNTATKQNKMKPKEEKQTNKQTGKR
ncbi:hypothetical protein, unlikely [Trypanosoma congolense IL3000]|uniref:Uncharacterized protein n=1 Tax=Trypanosoma congolense (strain IL3000) TaxID=1068625 RepID=F9W8R8_TRYCI|nr:hypothetical protein, unlikely [Trypanosoma congolense IL3000]